MEPHFTSLLLWVWVPCYSTLPLCSLQWQESVFCFLDIHFISCKIFHYWAWADVRWHLGTGDTHHSRQSYCKIQLRCRVSTFWFFFEISNILLRISFWLLTVSLKNVSLSADWCPIVREAAVEWSWAWEWRHLVWVLLKSISGLVIMRLSPQALCIVSPGQGSGDFILYFTTLNICWNFCHSLNTLCSVICHCRKIKLKSLSFLCESSEPSLLQFDL